MTHKFSLQRIPWLVVIAAGLIVAALDAAFFSAFWAPRGIAPTRILQGIAAGLLGKASFSGGAATMWLGALLHCFIATMMALAYTVVSRRYHALIQHPLRWGVPYGLFLWAFMSYIVVPLSAAPQSSTPDLSWTISSIIMHIVFGVICALFARRALRAPRGVLRPALNG